MVHPRHNNKSQSAMDMSSPHGISEAFKAELKEIREECCSGRNINYLYAQLIVLLDNYALETEKLPANERQIAHKMLRRQLSPKLRIFSKAWREVCKNGRLYWEKIEA